MTKEMSGRLRIAVLASLMAWAVLACTEAPSEDSTAKASREDAESSEQAVAEDELEGALQSLTLARQAEADGDFETALDHALNALEGAPRHPIFIQTAARAMVRQGREPEALDLLQRMADIGAAATLDPEVWSGLATTSRFQKISERLSGAGDWPRGEVVYRLGDASLFPEGIAWDPVEGAFYVGSTAQSKILRIPADGEPEEFITENQNGLLNPLGMVVDSERRGLWVASTAFPSHGGAGEDDAGWSAVFHFNLEDGSLRRLFPLDERPRSHFLNDLDVAHDGTVFITDSLTSEVYHIAPGGKDLELFVTLPKINALNGLALTDDGRYLYVTYLEGLSRIDLETRQILSIEEGPGISIGHGDGMAFHRGDLLVIQNQPYFRFRVARFGLDATGLKADTMDVLHAGLVGTRLPYTGAIAGDRFYFNVSATLDSEANEEEPLVLVVDL